MKIEREDFEEANRKALKIGDVFTRGDSIYIVDDEDGYVSLETGTRFSGVPKCAISLHPDAKVVLGRGIFAEFEAQEQTEPAKAETETELAF